MPSTIIITTPFRRMLELNGQRATGTRCRGTQLCLSYRGLATSVLCPSEQTTCARDTVL